MSDSIKNLYPYTWDIILQRVRTFQEKHPYIDITKTVDSLLAKSSPIPDEMVGVVAGQSIGERLTQLTLNTFHSCGVTETTVSSGVPRISELLNLTTFPKHSPRRQIVLQLKHNNAVYDEHTVERVFQYCEEKVISRTLGDIVYTYHMREYCTEQWYDLSNDPEPRIHSIVLHLNKKYLTESHLMLEDVRDKLVECFEHLDIKHHIDVSSWSMGHVHIHVYHESDIPVVLSKWKIIKSTHISGIPACTSYTLDKTFNLKLIGCHLTQFIASRAVDIYKSHSNDVWEMYAMFGVECVRQFIIHEISEIIDNISLHHIILVVDVMTWNGYPVPLNRFGISKVSNSIMSNCAFERPMNVIIDGAYDKVSDPIHSVSGCVMTGKLGTFGTGSVKLLEK